MKKIKLLLIAASLLAIQFQATRAQTFTVKSHKVTVSGTSSLHDWESMVDNLEAKGFLVSRDKSLSDIRDVVVTIPVTAIKSTKGKMMDNKTWEAFNYENNPVITFTLTGKKINTTSLIATGVLSMAGVSRPVELHLAYKLLPAGELEISGSHTLLMSDFNMEPPTAMMGTIKVGAEVVVNFQLTLVDGTNTL